jgi:hypothetical protein
VVKALRLLEEINPSSIKVKELRNCKEDRGPDNKNKSSLNTRHHGSWFMVSSSVITDVLRESLKTVDDEKP